MILLKKEAAMKQFRTFSLSMQKQIKEQNIMMESAIDKSFINLGFRSLLHACNICKIRGHSPIEILYALVLLPFLNISMTSLWAKKSVKMTLEAQKDSYYRFLNCEQFHWRRFIYRLFLRISSTSKASLQDKVLIVDDTVIPKTGKKMEMVGYHYDSGKKRTRLGYKLLQLGYHDGVNFYPVDMTVHTSNNRPNEKSRTIDKRTIGWRRRQEAGEKRTDALLKMLDRAWKSGIDASFVLFDSWFAHDSVISSIVGIGYGVICRLKRNRVKYLYDGQAYTLKQLWQKVAKNKAISLQRGSVKGFCLDVSLPKSGRVRLLFISNGKKDWQAFLCTDTDMDASQILDYYARRWSIELYFKDAKQMLYLGKEQSEIFEAVIASISITMIRYLLLVYLMRQMHPVGPVGPLFKELAETQLQLLFLEKIWLYIKELMITSSDLFYLESDKDNLFQLINFIENIITEQLAKPTAKL